MSEIQVIRAELSHATELTALSLTSFKEAFEKDNNPEDFKAYVDEAFSQRQIVKDLEESGSIFFLAYINHELAGYARLRNSTEVQAQFPNKKMIELHRLYALGKFIGRGVGKTLMNHCITHAKQKGLDMIWLGVWEKNDHAQGFYKNFGFEKFSSHVFVVGTDPQTDFLLKKDL
jgi:diamine N-acetyltransferase